MNTHTKKTNLTSSNSTFNRSVSKETKKHFDSLLKKALNKNDKSRKAVNNEDRSTEVIHKAKFLPHDSESNCFETKSLGTGNFILEKFLSDAVNSKKNSTPKSSNKLINSITFIKAPTKDKKVNSSPVSAEQTYNVSSVDHTNEILDKIEKLSSYSNETYDIQNEDNGSNISERTYSLDKPHHEILNKKNDVPLGEIEIHTSKSKSLVKVVSNSKKTEIQSANDTTEVFEEIKKLQNDTSATEVENETTNEIKRDSYEEHSKLSKEKKFKRKKIKKLYADGSNSRLKSNIYSYEDLIGIIVYNTDKLVLNSLIHQPCVKIHIVDIETGEYLSRSKGFDEDLPRIKYNYPQITKSFELQQHKSLIPYWEELIVFHDDFEYFLDYKESIIVLFELLDFSTYFTARTKYTKEGSSSGWHKIAWAFLKPCSKTGSLNIEEKIRLQLYKPKKTVIKKLTSECVLYDWWCKGNHVKYPSTLYVSIKRVKASSLKDTKHSDAVFKSELNLDIIEKDEEKHKSLETDTKNIYFQPVTWPRTPNENCKIPNKVQNKLRSSKKGCFAVKFSNNGLLLACGVADDVKFPIIVYSALGGNEEYCKFSGHQGIIYNLYWTADDKYLISASADCAVSVWNVYKKHFYYKQVLPHPSFVYCAILNENTTQIITACYDQIMRVWQASSVAANYDLQQELLGHYGYLTTLCFGKEKNMLYSGDSAGLIIEWTFNQKEWVFKRIFKLKELHKTVINNIVLHPGSNRLIVFCRDSAHRMVDINVGCIIQWYRGIVNYRVHTTGSISPCGNLVFASSENGYIYIWNTDTGVLLATFNAYSTLSKNAIIPHCIHFHPFDNIIAISHYGSNVPIIFCTHDSNVTENDMLKNSISKDSVKEIKSKTRSSIPKLLTKNKKSTKVDNVSFNQIIDKIDDVLVYVKSDQNL